MPKKEGDLYGGTPPFEESSDTSEAAAYSMVDHVAGLRARTLRYYELCGADGATVDEVEVACDMLHQTASARVRELFLLGDLVKTNERRRTRTGRYARVLVVVEFDADSTDETDPSRDGGGNRPGGRPGERSGAARPGADAGVRVGVAAHAGHGS